MKKLLLIIVSILLNVISHSAFASPSPAIVKSCLQNRAIDKVVLASIPTNESYLDEKYKDSFSANYVTYRGKDIGYATKKNQHAIIYDNQLFLINQVNYLKPAKFTTKPTEINFDLAFWYILSEKNNQFLCVTDNFPGIGRSGSYQNIRYAYLLSLNGEKQLFFTVDDVRSKKALLLKEKSFRTMHQE